MHAGSKASSRTMCRCAKALKARHSLSSYVGKCVLQVSPIGLPSLALGQLLINAFLGRPDRAAIACALAESSTYAPSWNHKQDMYWQDMHWQGFNMTLTYPGSPTELHQALVQRRSGTRLCLIHHSDPVKHQTTQAGQPDIQSSTRKSHVAVHGTSVFMEAVAVAAIAIPQPSIAISKPGCLKQRQAQTSLVAEYGALTSVRIVAAAVMATAVSSNAAVLASAMAGLDGRRLARSHGVVVDEQADVGEKDLRPRRVEQVGRDPVGGVVLKAGGGAARGRQLRGSRSRQHLGLQPRE